jgi:glycosyltransferase involved in cell wall biosynthesis
VQGLDILVNPSLRAWSETFCIANVEAMAAGLPVVSFGVGGTGEYLRHGCVRMTASLHDNYRCVHPLLEYTPTMRSWGRDH